MGVITYNPTDNKYDVAAGTYTVRFRGTVDKPPFQNARGGKAPSNEPRLGWQFEVIGPPGSTELGKVIEQSTGSTPSKKSKLVYVLNLFLAPAGLQPGQQFDPQHYVGRTFEVVWGPNPDSDSGGLHIAFLRATGAPAPQAPRPPSAPPAAPTPPKAPPSAPPAPFAAPPPLKKWWLSTPNGPEQIEEMELRSKMGMERLDPKDVMVCPLDGSEWVTAASVGLSGIPF